MWCRRSRGVRVCIEAFREARASFVALEHALVVDGAELEDGERDYAGGFAATNGDIETARTDAEDDASLIHTSGTTGDPKGVRHAHRFVLGHLPLFVTAFANMDVREGDVCFTPAEWAWVASLFDVVFAGLYYGLPILAYSGGEFDPETAFDLLERYGVTNFFAPPTALRRTMQVDDPARFDVGALRRLRAAASRSASPSSTGRTPRSLGRSPTRATVRRRPTCSRAIARH
jgi:acetyl-CoA synthetase